MSKVITFGEIMLRLNPPGFNRITETRTFEALYAGGEANVAASLACYNQQTEFVSRVPANDLGDACIAYLRQHGIGTSHILRGGDRLGIYFLEAGAAQRASKVVYDRAGSSFAAIKPGMVDWKTVFQGADWFHWTGITPAVSEGAALACAEAIGVARQMGITVSCDLNYRAKLWKWGKKAGEVMQDLVAGCDVAVGNEEDAEKVFGITAPEADVTGGKVEAEQYRFVCEKLAERFPNLKTVAVTLRGSISASHNTWSGALWQGGAVLHRAGVRHRPDRGSRGRRRLLRRRPDLRSAHIRSGCRQGAALRRRRLLPQAQHPRRLQRRHRRRGRGADGWRRVGAGENDRMMSDER